MTPDLPVRVSVVGGGRMGAGIAHAFLISGCEVIIVEQNAPAARAARDRVARAVAASVDRGLDADTSEVIAGLRATTDFTKLAGAELAIEAVPEDLDLKLALLPHLEASLDSTAVLASNTSSISIGLLARSLRRPEQFLGLHFFNPVPASTFVEIVTHTAAPTGLTRRAGAWVRALGKHAIVVADSPGFASSRLGVALALEAIRMVEEGVASAADIDTAMEQGYRHPMGPLKTTDIVGLDVRLGIAEQLERELGERFTPPGLLREMVARGEVGRKSGKGFYNY